MNTQKNQIPTSPNQEQIDSLVTSQANDDSAWEPAIWVDRSRAFSLSIPNELAARAAFLATLHRESGVDKWVERIVRERVELEEFAFAEAKKEMTS